MTSFQQTLNEWSDALGKQIDVADEQQPDGIDITDDLGNSISQWESMLNDQVAAPGSRSTDQDLMRGAAESNKFESVLPDTPVISLREVSRGFQQNMQSTAQAIATPAMRSQAILAVMKPLQMLTPWLPAFTSEYDRAVADQLSMLVEPAGSGLTAQDLQSELIATRGAQQGLAEGQKEGFAADVSRGIGQSLPSTIAMIGSLGTGTPLVAAQMASLAFVPLSSFTGGQLNYVNDLEQENLELAMSGEPLKQFDPIEMANRGLASAAIESFTEFGGAAIGAKVIGKIAQGAAAQSAAKFAVNKFAKIGAARAAGEVVKRTGSKAGQAFVAANNGLASITPGFLYRTGQIAAVSGVEEASEELVSGILNAPFTHAPLSKDVSDALYSMAVGGVAGGVGGAGSGLGLAGRTALVNRSDAFRPENDKERILRQNHDQAMKARSNWDSNLEEAQKDRISASLDTIEGMTPDERATYVKELADRKADILTNAEATLAERQEVDVALTGAQEALAKAKAAEAAGTVTPATENDVYEAEFGLLVLQEKAKELDNQIKLANTDHMIANAEYSAIAEKISDLPMTVVKSTPAEVLSSIGTRVNKTLSETKAPKWGKKITDEMKALGVEVSWFTPDANSTFSPGFHTRRTPGVIYLNSKSDQQRVRAVALEEAFHDIQMFRPDVAKAFADNAGLAPIYEAAVDYIGRAEGETGAIARMDEAAIAQAENAIDQVTGEQPAQISQATRRAGAARISQEGEANAFARAMAGIKAKGAMSSLTRLAARTGLMGRESLAALAVVDRVARAAAVERASGRQGDSTLSPLARTLMWASDMDVNFARDIPTADRELSEPISPPAAPVAAKPKMDRVAHKREKESGRYVGAPDWVGNSPAQLAKLRFKLRKLAKEGEAGRYWYEDSSRAILEMTGGDKVEAEKIVSLIAIYSPNATVSANTTMALTAYYQFKAGLDINAGFSKADEKATALLKNGQAWGGIKTNSFYQNLMIEIDPSKLDLNVSTMDMWMAIAFDYGDKVLDQGPKYRFAERETARLAQELGWTAHQVQAAIWSAMKGRIDPIRGQLKAEELRLGIGEMVNKVDPKTGKESLVYEVKKDKKKEHFRLAHKMGMEYDLQDKDINAAKFDFSTALRDRMVQQSYETTPSTASGAPIPGIHTATLDKQFEYQRALYPIIFPDKVDVIAQMVGLPQGATIEGVSAWESKTQTGLQAFAAAPTEKSGKAKKLRPSAVKLLDLASRIRGYVLTQDAVAYHTAIFDDAQIRHNGIQLNTKNALSHQEIELFYRALNEKFNRWDLAPIYRKDGLRVLNFTAFDESQKPVSNKEFKKAFDEIVTSLPDTFGGGIVDSVTFRSDGNLVSNDWSKDKNGEEYLASIERERPDLLQQVRDLRTAVQTVNDQFVAKYGWDKAGVSFARPQRFGIDVVRGRDFGVTAKYGTKQKGSVSVLGFHFSRARREVLDSTFYGTGIKDAGSERVRAAKDKRLKNRTFFYVDRGVGYVYEELGVQPEGFLPEGGVGTDMHGVNLRNMYDAIADPLGFVAKGKTKADGNRFWFNGVETAILDAGFDGVYMPNAMSSVGVAVLLGKHKVKVQYLGRRDARTGKMLTKRELQLQESYARPETPDQQSVNAAATQDLQFVKNLGGTTGAKLYQATDGQQYVVKQGASPDHVLSEYAVNNIYAAAGVPVPAHALDARDPQQPKQLTKYVAGTSLGDLTGKKFDAAVGDLQKNFVVDALVANWDVIGTDSDNVLLPSDGGEILRIDNGGSLTFRAQGGIKTFGSKVLELDSMRLSYQGRQVFGQLTNAAVAQQIQDLMPKREAILSATPVELRQVMSDRLDYLADWAQQNEGNNRVASVMQTDTASFARIPTPNFYKEVEEGKRQWVLPDADGNPTRLYHGTWETAQPIDPFVSQTGLRYFGKQAMSFTDDPEIANQFAAREGQILPVFVSAVNPLEYDLKGLVWNAIPLGYAVPLIEKTIGRELTLQEEQNLRRGTKSKDELFNFSDKVTNDIFRSVNVSEQEIRDDRVLVTSIDAIAQIAFNFGHDVFVGKNINEGIVHTEVVVRDADPLINALTAQTKRVTDAEFESFAREDERDAAFQKMQAERRAAQAEVMKDLSPREQALIIEAGVADYDEILDLKDKIDKLKKQIAGGTPAAVEKSKRTADLQTAAQRVNALSEVRKLERRLNAMTMLADQRLGQVNRAKARLQTQTQLAIEEQQSAAETIASLEEQITTTRDAVAAAKKSIAEERTATKEQRDALNTALANAEATAQRAINWAYAIGRNEGLVAGQVAGQQAVQTDLERGQQAEEKLKELQKSERFQKFASQRAIDWAYRIGRREGLVAGQVAGQQALKPEMTRLARVESLLDISVRRVRELKATVRSDARAAQRAVNFAYSMGLNKGRMQGIMQGRAQILAKMRKREDTLQNQLFNLRELMNTRLDDVAERNRIIRKITSEALLSIPANLRGTLANRAATATTVAQANRVAIEAVRIAINAEATAGLKVIARTAKRLNKRGMKVSARKQIVTLLYEANVVLRDANNRKRQAKVVTAKGSPVTLSGAIDLYSRVLDAQTKVENAVALYDIDRAEFIAERDQRIARYADLTQRLMANMAGRRVIAARARADQAARLSVLSKISRANSDIYTLALELEGKEDGVIDELLRLAQEGKGEAALEHARIMRDLEPALIAAGYEGVDDYRLKNGGYGDGSTELVTVSLGGQDVTIPLGIAMSIAAMDEETLALFDGTNAGKQGIQFNETSTTLTLYPSGDDIRNLRANLTVGQRDLIERMKDILETQIRDRAMQAIWEVTGDQPPIVTRYYPRIRNQDAAGGEKVDLSAAAGAAVRGALTAVGFANARTGGFAPLIYTDMVQTMDRHMQVALDMIHMAQPYRDAITVLNDPKVVKGIDDQLGSGTASGVRSIFSNGVGATSRTKPSIIDKLTSNVTGAKLAMNPSTIAKVLVGGTIRLSSEIPLSLWTRGTARAARYARTPGTWSGRIDQIHLVNGYFSRRHQMQMKSIFSGALGDSDRAQLGNALTAVRDNLRATGNNLAAGKITDAINAARDVNRAGVMGLSAVVDMLRYADEQIMLAAVEARLAEVEDEGLLTGTDALTEASNRAERDFRKTQNASDEFDDSFFAATSRTDGNAGWRLLFPFSSDPLKARNQIRRAVLSGNRTRTAFAVGGNIVSGTTISSLSTIVTAKVISLFAGMIGAGDDEEEKKAVNKAWWENTLVSVPTQLASDVMSVTMGYMGIMFANALSSIVYRRFLISPLIGSPAQDLVNEAKDALRKDSTTTDMMQAVIGGSLATLQYGGIPFYPLYRLVMRSLELGESAAKVQKTPREKLLDSMERKRKSLEKLRSN
jgi:hypothetical protein